MTELNLLKAVLSLLANARFDAKGADLMQIAEVIHQFNKYVENREAEQASKVPNE